MIAFAVTLKPEVRSTVARRDIAATLRKLMPECGLLRAMQFANLLLEGETLTIGQLEMADPWFLTKSVIFNVDRKAVLSPAEARQEELENENRLRLARFQRLLELGAKGDAVAAISYCKAELAGEVPHGPYAGGAEWE